MSITKVTGSWIQPYVDCTTDRSGQAAFWAGIDGFYGTGTVEQGGSAVYCRYVNPGWIAVYYAWYEFYPAGQQPISSIVVNANDTVSVTIAYSGNNSSVSVTVSDGTHSYTAWNNTGNDTLSTAECIAERPYQDGLTPLAKFSTAEFGKDYTSTMGCNATVAGTTGTLGSFSKTIPISMEGFGGTMLATPSRLSSDGSSFRVTWFAAQ